MKRIINFFILLYFTLPITIVCSQAAQSSLMPTFTWTNNKKDKSGKEQAPEQEFVTIANLTKILTHIAQEKQVENYWLFSSINIPNFKQLKVQKTDPRTLETTLAIYRMSIPANNNDHTNTSIWGYYPYVSKESNIGLNPHTAAEFSQIFAQNNTQTSGLLMPIIHCITTATFMYQPQATISPQSEKVIDNRSTYEQSKNSCTIYDIKK